MKILSWDVGIIHLAYCLIDTETNKILDWGNLNLLNDEEHKCHGFIDSNNKCSDCHKKCNFYFQNGAKTYYFCGLHKRQFQKINKEVLEAKQVKSDEPCSQRLNSGKQCKKKVKYQICGQENNKLLCKYHYNLLEKKDKQNTIKKIVKMNASKAPIDKIKLNLIKQLEEKHHFMDVSYVLIENQPSLKNPKMKSVAETLFTWFMIRSQIDKKNNSIIEKIMYLSPSNKLKIGDENIQKELDKLKNSSQKYSFTKKMAIVYTRELLKEDEKWLDFLNKNSKKDDLCDSYLQGLYFIKHKFKYI